MGSSLIHSRLQQGEPLVEITFGMGKREGKRRVSWPHLQWSWEREERAVGRLNRKRAFLCDLLFCLLGKRGVSDDTFTSLLSFLFLFVLSFYFRAGREKRRRRRREKFLSTVIYRSFPYNFCQRRRPFLNIRRRRKNLRETPVRKRAVISAAQKNPARFAPLSLSLSPSGGREYLLTFEAAIWKKRRKLKKSSLQQVRRI